MAKPNYGYEKRQRELEKKRKKAEKAVRKTSPGQTGGDGAPNAPDGNDPVSAPVVVPAVAPVNGATTA